MQSQSKLSRTERLDGAGKIRNPGEASCPSTLNNTFLLYSLQSFESIVQPEKSRGRAGGYKRGYTTIRILESVAKRVYERLCKVAA